MDNWPVSKDVKTIMGIGFETWVKGCILELSNELESPLLFVYKGDENSGNNAERFSIIEVFNTYSRFVSVCQYLRVKIGGKWSKKYCVSRDLSTATRIYNHYKKRVDLSDYVIADMEHHLYEDDAHKRIIYYSYICEITTFTEWAIPIFVEDEVVGVFITGQFKKDGVFDESVLRANLNENTINIISCGEIDTRIDPNEFNCLLEKSQPVPSDTKYNNFFNKIIETQDTLNSVFSDMRCSHAFQIQEQFLDCVWGTSQQDSLLSVNVNSSEVNYIADVNKNLKNICENLLMAMRKFKSVFKIKEIIVFTPPDDAEKIEDINHAVTIIGRKLTNEAAEGQMLGEESRFKIEYQKINWQDARKETSLKMYKMLHPDTTILKEENNENYNEFVCNSILILYALKEHEQYPIGFLLEFDSTERLKLWQNEEMLVEPILERICTSFLAQWYVAYSEFYRLHYKMINRYIYHELGQLVLGLSARTIGFEVYYQKANEEMMQKEDMLYGRFPSVAEHLRRTADYLKDVKRFKDMASLVSRISNSPLMLVNPMRTLFYPYKSVLFKMMDLYGETCRQNDKTLHIPFFENPNEGKDERPLMMADPDMFEQIADNLIRNAVKYSYVGTKITVDCKLSEDGKNYNLSVANYGMPILEEEKDYIYMPYYRGATVKKYGHSGIGFGLYLAKVFAQAHKGDIKFESYEISKFNVPLLSLYLQLDNKDTVLYQECQNEIKQLKKEGKYEQIVNPIRVNPFTRLYVERSIHLPTNYTIFTFSMPYKKEIS